MARIVYVDENFQTFFSEIGPSNPEVTIGRNKNNTIRISSLSLSRFHAKLIYQEGRYIFIDLKSSNGCFVNDKRISREAVRHGDRLRCGDVKLEFIDESESKGRMSGSHQGVSRPPSFSGGVHSAPSQVSLPMTPASMGPPPINPQGSVSESSSNKQESGGVIRGMDALSLRLNDPRHYNVRPITTMGNYRPTSLSQPVFDPQSKEVMELMSKGRDNARVMKEEPGGVDVIDQVLDAAAVPQGFDSDSMGYDVKSLTNRTSTETESVSNVRGRGDVSFDGRLDATAVPRGFDSHSMGHRAGRGVEASGERLEFRSDTGFGNRFDNRRVRRDDRWGRGVPRGGVGWKMDSQVDNVKPGESQESLASDRRYESQWDRRAVRHFRPSIEALAYSSVGVGSSHVHGTGFVESKVGKVAEQEEIKQTEERKRVSGGVVDERGSGGSVEVGKRGYDSGEKSGVDEGVSREGHDESGYVGDRTSKLLRESEERLLASEAKLVESEEHLLVSESKLRESEEHLLVSESKLRESEERLLVSESKLRESEERLLESQLTVSKFQSEISVLEQKLKSSEERVNQLVDSQVKSEQLLSSAQKQVEEIEVLKGEIGALEELLEESQGKFEHVEGELEGLLLERKDWQSRRRVFLSNLGKVEGYMKQLAESLACQSFEVDPILLEEIYSMVDMLRSCSKGLSEGESISE